MRVLAIALLLMMLFAQVAENATQEIGIDHGLAEKVVMALKEKDLNKLASFVHPTDGVRFSPLEIVKAGDRIFLPQALKDPNSPSRIYDWGIDIGRLSFTDYLGKFVYDQDYLKCSLGLNTTLGQKKGRSRLSTLTAFYKGSWVECHKQGQNAWYSLWLVFEEYRNKMYLVGIIHGESKP